MNIIEFADYTRHLNAAAGDAARALIRVHQEEYERLLETRMDALGYKRNPRAVEYGQRAWIMKGK